MHQARSLVRFCKSTETYTFLRKKLATTEILSSEAIKKILNKTGSIFSKTKITFKFETLLNFF